MTAFIYSLRFKVSFPISSRSTGRGNFYRRTSTK